MKKLLLSLFIYLLYYPILVQAQLNVNSNVSPADLVASFVGPNVTISNISLTGAAGSYATFSNGNTTNIGITKGALLTTGLAVDAIGPNNSGSKSTDHAISGNDPQLAPIIGADQKDLLVLEFDMVPQMDKFKLQFVFASEEYLEWVDAGYSDGFGFFLTGPGPACQTDYYSNTNIATLPNGTPININNVNTVNNSAYYINNPLNATSTIQYDGFTTKIIKEVAVCPNQTYHFKIAIADGGDGIYDSAVFLEQINEAPIITSNGGGATASVSVVENGTAVTTVTATDADAGTTLTYSISGGTDASKFSINGSTGVLAFVTAPDFENPTDAGTDNIYEVKVKVSDGAAFDEQVITVTVTNENDNTPVITSNGGGATASISVAENGTAVTTVTATDADAGTTLTYSISGGADASKFSINGSTGVLAFVTAPDFENPTDADGNNTYIVTVRVSDGTHTDEQAITVTVTDLNDNAPVITSNGGGATAGISVAENGTAVTTVTATDADAGTTLTYSISGGADASKFSINGSTGVLAFVTAPDFENPTDADGNNTYIVTVRVSDGTHTDEQAITVTVTDLNDNAPVITSNGGGATAGISVAENGTAVTTVTATDADASTTLAYSISGGADAAKFSINGSTGVLTFVTAPDFESPADADGNNTYIVTVRVSDGTHTDEQAITVTVTDLNDNAPVITSNGGGATASISVAENSTAVTTVTATDADAGTTLAYSISGGADAAKFSINGSTGVLAFVTAPDFENPTDADGNNTYIVTVRVSDGTHTDEQALTVTVTDLNDNAPVITSNGGGATAGISVAENSTAVTTVTATDADASTTLAYSISGGADAAKFSINSSTGILTFVTAPDFENPTDADGNNTYIVTVRVSDGTHTDEQAITITVTNVNETPIITSNGGGATAGISVAENSTAVTTVTATDADAGTTLTYSISGGADAAKFSINSSTGVLAFTTAPDFENPTDADGNNTYMVTVRVSDGAAFDEQTLTVTVTDLNDNTPVITSNGGGATAGISVAENSTAVTTVTATDADAGTTLTYSISGGADAAKFSINSSTGVLSFVAAPDFENPTDAGTDNIYEVKIKVSDGAAFDEQTLTVTVTDLNDNTPVITSNGGGATAGVSVAENSTAVTTVTATDADAGTTLAYSISGGADASKFSINGSTGVLSFVAAPDFENPTDADGNNTYIVTVRVSDGTHTNEQALTVTVTDENDNLPIITSNGGGVTGSISVAENGTAVTTVTATDADAGTTLAYSISGGTDASKFSINGSTGVLAFVTAPDFENPTDADGNNTYIVTVRVSDGTHTDEQTLTITVTDLNDNAPVITSNGGGPTASVSVAENGTAVTTVTATDADAGTTLAYSISGGADASKFSINGSTGVLSFVAAPDFENPTDSDGNNTYIVTVRVSDGTHTDEQAITITVTNVNETPIITSNGGGATAGISVAENGTAVTTVTATDADAGTTLTYSISGGADAAKFSINSSTGVLSFVAAPDFENPTDADGNNTYIVTVRVSDGAAFDEQALTVTVTDLNDNTPVITSNGGGATAGISVAENSTAITTVTATDADAGTTLTYSISGGADAAKFSINSSTGVLAFVTAPDFENPADADGNNTYIVAVRVSDGTHTAEQAITVAVTDLNDNTPVITSNGGGATAGISVAENGTAVTTVTATDADAGTTLTYSISGGADASKFSINSSTGVLAFVAAPDFENPTDADGNNTYIVTVRVSDGMHTDEQTLTATITDENDNAPVITSNGGGATASVSVAENGTAVTTVTATDADAGTTLAYSISGGADASKFSINSSTGVLAFVTAPDFENPTDAGTDNVYEVKIKVSDGAAFDEQTLTVTVTDLNDNTPVITSNGGGPTASVSVAENSTAVTTVTATDTDAGTTLTYSISGGTDASKFSINSSTGVLAFVTAPDFENPTDANTDNQYVVLVRASDGTHTDEQTLTVTVTDLNDNTPVITSNGGGATASISIAENSTAVTTVTATDADAGTTLTYSISGGADAAKFNINSSTGVLSFVAAPDFENPTDADGNNTYMVTVRVSDGTAFDEQTLTVTVTDLNDNTPVITSNGGGATASISVAENSTAVTTVTATDADAGTTLTYSISGGADAAKFSINSSTGVLSFVAAPDFENPTDSNTDNQYVVLVRASDGTAFDEQALTVTVTDLNDNPPIITSNGGGATAGVSVAENSTAVTTVTATDADAGTTLTYSISGGADASKFSINGSTGVLAFVTAPDFENPTDADGNNTYMVTVRVSDGTAFDEQALTVTVTDLNDNTPVITSNGGGATASISVAENSTAVTTVTATDADAGTTLAYSISGGADASKFSINSSTGVLSFVAAPDFENPTDANTDNQYVVLVRASDGTAFDEQALTVTVTDLNDNPPIITSNSGGATAGVSVAENSTAVTTVTATDADAGTTLTYSISGGADASKFSINSSTGVLTFVTAPDFENPTDANTDNQYVVLVRASDGTHTDEQTLTVTVSDVNEAPTEINISSTSIFENLPAGTTIGTLETVDFEGGSFTYTLVPGSGSTDNAAFQVNGNMLQSAQPFNFEAKNLFSIRVRTTDEGGLSFEKVLSVSVLDVNEAPTLDLIPDFAICTNTNAQKIELTGISAGPEMGQTVVINVNTSDNALFETLMVQDNAIHYQLKPSVVGSAVIEVTIKDNGGTANGGIDQLIRSFTMTVNPLPVLNISTPKLKIGRGETIKLTATGAATYNWTPIDGVVAGNHTSVLTIRPSQTTTYKVIGTNVTECSESAVITIEVEDDYNLIGANNILTPNGDGKNDFLAVRNLDMYPNNELLIYDRAGRLVYQRKNYQNDWNGVTNDGQPLVEGTYYWIIDFGPAKVKKKGYVSIVRDK